MFVYALFGNHIHTDDRKDVLNYTCWLTANCILLTVLTVSSLCFC
jgi:hypothetical protein